MALQNRRLIDASLGIGIAALVVEIIAVGSPYWFSVQDLHSGVWMVCQKGQCQTFLSDETFKAIRAFAIICVVSAAISTVLTIISICTANVSTLVASAVFQCIAALSAPISAVIYLTNVPALGLDYLSWAWYFNIISTGGFILNAILQIAAAIQQTRRAPVPLTMMGYEGQVIAAPGMINPGYVGQVIPAPTYMQAAPTYYVPAQGTPNTIPQQMPKS